MGLAGSLCGKKPTWMPWASFCEDSYLHNYFNVNPGLVSHSDPNLLARAISVVKY